MCGGAFANVSTCAHILRCTVVRGARAGSRLSGSIYRATLARPRSFPRARMDASPDASAALLDPEQHAEPRPEQPRGHDPWKTLIRKILLANRIGRDSEDWKFFQKLFQLPSPGDAPDESNITHAAHDDAQQYMTLEDRSPELDELLAREGRCLWAPRWMGPPDPYWCGRCKRDGWFCFTCMRWLGDPEFCSHFFSGFHRNNARRARRLAERAGARSSSATSAPVD